MSDQDLFDPAQRPEQTPNTPGDTNNIIPPSSDSMSTLLLSIRNKDGKPKYNSVEQALEALRHSQEHIERLETERRQQAEESERLRSEVNSRQSVEDVVSRLLSAQPNPETTPQVTPDRSGTVDRDAVNKLVQEALQRTQVMEEAKKNSSFVQSQLQMKFGEKARDAVAQKAQELGMTPQELGNLASRNPKMVLALFNVASSNRTTTTNSSINLPLTPDNQEPTPPQFTRSMLQGVSLKTQVDAFKASRDYTNKRLGVSN